MHCHAYLTNYCRIATPVTDVTPDSHTEDMTVPFPPLSVNKLGALAALWVPRLLALTVSIHVQYNHVR